jgi:hypothetical protein
MTHVQPYPMAANGSAGISGAFLSPLNARAAIAEWCRSKGWGWFHLVRRAEGPFRSVLWEARWPLEGERFRFTTLPV